MSIFTVSSERVLEAVSFWSLMTWGRLSSQNVAPAHPPHPPICYSPSAWLAPRGPDRVCFPSQSYQPGLLSSARSVHLDCRPSAGRETAFLLDLPSSLARILPP